MEILKAIILGIIQGLTEFLPVSSSGHLILGGHFLKFHKPDISFEIILHLGSLLAVLIYFRKDIQMLLNSLFKFKDKSPKNVNNRKILFYLLIATFVTGIIGYAFSDLFEKMFTTPLVACVMLIVTGIILFISDIFRNTRLDASQTGIGRSLLIGLGQSFAIVPGISRSGSTIAIGIFTGLKREQAARFSFLLSIPAILGATLLKIDAIINLESQFIIKYILGTIFAFISGYLVIAWLIKLVKKQKLKYFSYYCWLIAIISGILILTGN